jgi:hypothetical protein
MPGSIKVLMLAADPDEGRGGLRIDHEIRGAIEAVRRGRAATELEIAAELAVRPEDLNHALLRHDPQVVHFSGHGEGEDGLVLDEGRRVPPDALAALFKTFYGVRVVVLNACESVPIAEVLREVVDYTVAMERAIDDDDAVVFSGAFYAALSFGRTVPFAFQSAVAALMLEPAGTSPIPRLLMRDGVEPAPLEPREKKPEAAGGLRQVNDVSGVEAAGDASVTNEARGGSAPGGRTSQTNRVNGVKAGGSVNIGNRG